MRQRIFCCSNTYDRKTTPCPCCVLRPDTPDDAELEHLFHDLALTLFELMEPDDADILARAEFRGQTPSEIAARIGCSRTEATRRLQHAQRCFCRLMVVTLAPEKSE